MRKSSSLLTLLGVLAVPAVTWAHPGHVGHGGGTGHGFENGLLHPITGWDHLLALVAIGLLAVRIGGRASWAVPMGFLASCALGGIAALAGLSLPAVEVMILASIFVPAWLIARQTGATLTTAVIASLLFGVFHGFAHIAEMASSDGVGAYALGLLTTSAGLLAASVIAGLLIGRSATALEHPARLWRLAGAALSVSAVVLMAST